MKLNKEWHEAHPMPETATMDQRIAWHVDHAEACGCRAIPRLVVAEMAARGIEPPKRRGS